MFHPVMAFEASFHMHKCYFNKTLSVCPHHTELKINEKSTSYLSDGMALLSCVIHPNPNVQFLLFVFSLC